MEKIRQICTELWPIEVRNWFSLWKFIYPHGCHIFGVDFVMKERPFSSIINDCWFNEGNCPLLI